ncbi:MAG: YbdK family carboxylate-amine ligase [Pseudomonadota bacterium]
MKQPQANVTRQSSTSMLDRLASLLPARMRKPVRSEIDFQSAGVLTLGVEVELQLIDKTSMNLVSRAEELLAAGSHISKLKPEFYLSTVEINTGKCGNAHDVEQDLRASMSAVSTVAEQLGIALSTTGAHPFAKYSDCVISPSARYKELIDRNQWLTRRMTVYGLHVHLGMASGDDCIRFNNFFMHFLPHLLALSSSSPYWQGIDTGLSSYRPTTYEALPTAGQPYHVRSWKDFLNLYDSLKKCGSIRTLKDLWWDLRPSPGFGTLEIRVCDGCATLTETMAIVALIHTLAHWFAENGSWLESVSYPPSWVARENKWRVMRHGLNAELVLNPEGKTRLLRDELQEWLEKLQPYARRLGYQRYLACIAVIMKNGNSSERQRQCFAKHGQLEEVVRHNINEFNRTQPLWDGVPP